MFESAWFVLLLFLPSMDVSSLVFQEASPGNSLSLCDELCEVKLQNVRICLEARDPQLPATDA